MTKKMEAATCDLKEKSGSWKLNEEGKANYIVQILCRNCLLILKCAIPVVCILTIGVGISQ